MNDLKKTQRANIARTLAWLLTEPDREMVEALEKGEIYYFFSSFFKSMNHETPDLEGFLPWKNQSAFLDGMKEAYARLFRDHQSSDLWWIESVHKAWTSDPECRMSIAKEKGYVMGDSALHMMELYRFFGLEMRDGFNGLPDHIILELEFLAFLIARGSEDSAKIFLRDHLDWVPEMVRRGMEYQPSPFYCSVFEALKAFIASEREELYKEAKHDV